MSQQEEQQGGEQGGREEGEQQGGEGGREGGRGEGREGGRGEGREGGRREGGRPGFGRDRKRRRRARKTKDEELQEWIPQTKLGRLVKDKKILYLEEIFLHSLAVKEPEIIDFFLKDTLKDEVMKIMPVQKQTRAGQRTKFKAIVAIGDHNGHVGLGLKCAKETAIAIRGAINMAKLSIIPVRRGYWGNKIGKPHTVPSKVSGKCGSVRVRVIPAPRGTGLVAAYVPTRLLNLAGIEDAYTKTRGSTKTLGNFARATFNALSTTYSYLTPDLWPEFELEASPLEENAKYLQDVEDQKKLGEQL